MKVVKGKLVTRDPSRLLYDIPEPRFRSISAPGRRYAKEPKPKTKGFVFKVYTSIREILTYLEISSVAFLFNDYGYKTTSEFYQLDDHTLKKMLVPARARLTILAYIKFYNKETKKRHDIKN